MRITRVRPGGKLSGLGELTQAKFDSCVNYCQTQHPSDSAARGACINSCVIAAQNNTSHPGLVMFQPGFIPQIPGEVTPAGFIPVDLPPNVGTGGMDFQKLLIPAALAVGAILFIK